MDPLILFVASIVGSIVTQALRESGSAQQFYPQQGRRFTPFLGWIPMPGRGVNWWVEPGEAVWIEARYLRPISGNVFYPDKLGAVASSVREAARHGHQLDFYAPYGQIRRITPEVVAESVQYAQYDAGDPFTTGDRRLDQWLADREQGLAGDDLEMKDLLEEAVRQGSGDLGKWSATVRDGNHRAFGAVLGGEERVAIRLYDNDAQWLREQVKKGTLSGEYLALVQKAQSDTGQAAPWMGGDPPSRPVGDPLARLQSTDPFDRLMAIRPAIAAAAQPVYDRWDPEADPEEGDPEFGHGGICDRIASEIGSVLAEWLPEVELDDYGWEGDDHAAVIAVFPDGRRFLVDIPHAIYETGSGYAWEKIPGIRFSADDVVIEEV